MYVYIPYNTKVLGRKNLISLKLIAYIRIMCVRWQCFAIEVHLEIILHAYMVHDVL